jgi:hypothetical protein
MMRLEWAYRLVQEPARLWRRYIIGIPVFLFRVLQYRFSRRARILGQPDERIHASGEQKRIEQIKKAG